MGLLAQWEIVRSLSSMLPVHLPIVITTSADREKHGATIVWNLSSSCRCTLRKLQREIRRSFEFWHRCRRCGWQLPSLELAEVKETMAWYPWCCGGRRRGEGIPSINRHHPGKQRHCVPCGSCSMTRLAGVCMHCIFVRSFQPFSAVRLISEILHVVKCFKLWFSSCGIVYS
jgi:hypothetical protein